MVSATLVPQFESSHANYGRPAHSAMRATIHTLRRRRRERLPSRQPESVIDPPAIVIPHERSDHNERRSNDSGREIHEEKRQSKSGGLQHKHANYIAKENNGLLRHQFNYCAHHRASGASKGKAPSKNIRKGGGKHNEESDANNKRNRQIGSPSPPNSNI